MADLAEVQRLAEVARSAELEARNAELEMDCQEEKYGGTGWPGEVAAFEKRVKARRAADVAFTAWLDAGGKPDPDAKWCIGNGI